jgi:hypothetical protein
LFSPDAQLVKDLGERYPARALVDVLRGRTVVDGSCDGEGMDDVRLLLDDGTTIAIDTELDTSPYGVSMAESLDRPPSGPSGEAGAAPRSWRDARRRSSTVPTPAFASARVRAASAVDLTPFVRQRSRATATSASTSRPL